MELFIDEALALVYLYTVFMSSSGWGTEMGTKIFILTYSYLGKTLSMHRN
jgi:hypothetical protein